MATSLPMKMISRENIDDKNQQRLGDLGKHA
jgi:hypothetical protein